MLLEGVLSFGSMIRAVTKDARPLPSAHRFMSHDGVLGWMAPADIRDTEAYGDWIPLTTNNRGFRHPASVSQAIRDGEFRILCAGGSGVFGVNVADQETFCARLGGAGDAVTSVNAGQPAFGPGQTWMLLRDRLDVELDVLLFAMDSSDLLQLQANENAGFPKPRIRVGESGLEVANTPIPKRPFLLPWVQYNHDRFARSHVLSTLLYKPQGMDTKGLGMSTRMLMTGLIPELKSVAESRGAQLVVVYLPTHPRLQHTREFLDSLSGDFALRGIPLIDLSDPATLGELTTPRDFFDRQGLLTPRAHQLIANALTRDLVQLESLEIPAFQGGPWRARYFKDAVFQEPVGVEQHAVSAVYWGESAPRTDMPADGFSVILESCLPLEEPRRIRVRLESDGPATFSINDQTVLDTGEGEGALFRVNAVDIPAGDNRMRVRYRDSAGAAAVRLLFRLEDGTVVTPGRDMLEAPGAGGCGA